MTIDEMRKHYTCKATKALHEWKEDLAGEVSCARCYFCLGALEVAEDLNTLLSKSEGSR